MALDWWTVLIASRRASLDGTRPFTASDLVHEAKIEDTKRSSKEDIASAWLGKFVRWGYVLQKGTAKGDKRWIRTFELTKYGKERPEPGPSPKWAKKPKDE